MAKGYTTKEAKQLVASHRDLLRRMEQTADYADTAARNIRTAAAALADHSAQQVLVTIPVEELNRDKQGIRTKLLRDAGYGTVGSLQGTTKVKLSAIKGVSDEGAELILQSVKDIAAATRQETRLRLNADDRNPASAGLVRALYVYRNTYPAIRTCAKMVEQTKSTTLSLMMALEAADGGLKRLFAGKTKKNDAEQAYIRLKDALNGEYGQVARSCLSGFEWNKNTADDVIWEDFSKDPIAYITLLEAACPGLMGPQDAAYGLPEDLAKAIDAYPLQLDGLRCTLRRYQEWGVKYALHQKRALLGDEMGLGKTVQAIAAMTSLKNSGRTHFMVVCPASVLTNWCREVEKFSEIPVVRIHGDNKSDAMEQWKRDGGAAVTTFETTGMIAPDENGKIDMLIVDEAHYIKNPEARRTVHTKALCEKAEHILFMTGTALENRVEEMVSLMNILQPELANEVRQVSFLASAPQFRQIAAPVYFRRRRDEVLTELPELIENTEWCTMGAEEERVYEQAVLEGHFANARRVSWSVGDLAQSSKAQRLQEIVEEAEEDGRKVIVFSFFLDTIGKVCQLLGDRCTEPINGSVSPQRRQEIVDEFDKAPAGAVLPAQIQAGGTGLNIQAASVVVLCEPQLKPSIENQAISRAYRMGQARNVLVYRLLCDETIDERIMDLLAEKQKQFDAFADESVVALESLQLDEAASKALMTQEAQRIEQKNKKISTT